MNLSPDNTLSLDQQLQNLEDFYAQCLADDVGAKTLNRIWSQIKALRQQLEIPIYSFEI